MTRLPSFRMIKRNLEGPLRALARQMPVVAVTGPRQSGKTTLCRATFPDKTYVTLEPLDVRSFATEDPRGFLAAHPDGAVLDEVQRAPELFSYLQELVDERPEAGLFILTGSQHFGLTEAITQSLAGRIATLHLLPPSLDELQRFGTTPTDLFTTLWSGAYLRIHDQGLDPARWLADYVTTYVQRDVRQLTNVTNLQAFTTFLRLAAGRTANEVNLSALGGDAGVTHNTARSWLSVLEASFVTFRAPAWHRNLRKQVIKAPKLYFFDTGLACHLLGITEPEQLRHHPLRGALFESWVASEIVKARVHAGMVPGVHHFRDAKGLEVDLVLEEGGTLTAAEVKSGATVASDFFRSLERLGEELEAKLPHLTYRPRLVYGGAERHKRSDIDIIPWFAIQELPW